MPTRAATCPMIPGSTSASCRDRTICCSTLLPTKMRSLRSTMTPRGAGTGTVRIWLAATAAAELLAWITWRLQRRRIMTPSSTKKNNPTTTSRTLGRDGCSSGEATRAATFRLRRGRIRGRRAGRAAALRAAWLGRR